MLLVRVAPEVRGPVQAVLPGARTVDLTELPVVIRTTGSRNQAHKTASRLRAAGAIVLVIEEPMDGGGAFCVDHPDRVAARVCIGCGRPTCTSCRDLARGENVCVACRRKGLTPRARTRRRQLFMFFLFTVFLYEVVDFLRADRAAVNPDGRVRVAVYQFVPPDVPTSPVVEHLNRPSDPNTPYTSLHDIALWFNDERARYGRPGVYLDLDVFGPWGRVVEPPRLDDPNLPAWLFGLRAWQYARYFHNLTTDNGEDPDEYAARLYVVYSRNADDLAAHSRGSKKGRVAAVYVDLDETNPAYGTLTVAHELAHTLGAKDYYSPRTSLAVHPEGFVEPFINPLYPQEFAELMAGDIPVGPSSEREVTSLDDVRIGYATARDLGWIAAETAEAFYTPWQPSPEDGLRLSVRRGPGAAGDGRDPEGVEGVEGVGLRGEALDIGSGVDGAQVGAGDQ